MATIAVPGFPPVGLISRDETVSQTIQNGMMARADCGHPLESLIPWCACVARPQISCAAPHDNVSTIRYYSQQIWLPHYAGFAILQLGFTSVNAAELAIEVSTAYGGSFSDDPRPIPASQAEPYIWECSIEVGAGTAAISQDTLEFTTLRNSGSGNTFLEWVMLSVLPYTGEVTT